VIDIYLIGCPKISIKICALLALICIHTDLLMYFFPTHKTQTTDERYILPFFYLHCYFQPVFYRLGMSRGVYNVITFCWVTLHMFVLSTLVF
jgi:hypothetical protein